MPFGGTVQRGISGRLHFVDSMTVNHFYCILYLYVFQVGTPDYKFGAFDRASLRNLYYPKPSSLVLSKLYFPKGFDVARTPLVTFRLIDLLLSKDELISVHKPSQPKNVLTRPLQRHVMWTSLVAEYQFLAPLPKANYATMVVSTARHIHKV